MGNPRGFLDFQRVDFKERNPKERVGDFKEFYLPLSKKQQEVQGGRCMNCGVPFCHTGVIAQAQKQQHNDNPFISCAHLRISGGDVGCPLHNLIPEWNDLIYKGLWEEAYERLSLTNPFPEFTGKVCPSPCEDSCVCAINGESVTIKNNELAIIENAFAESLVLPFIPTKRSGKKVAVVGSGPAGLACAWELNRNGHQVVVYERSDRVGGLLMYGIPDMKLDKSVIERRVEVMRKSGIEFKVSSAIDSKKKAESLLKSYDAVVLATGASAPIDLELKGRKSDGIMFAVDFLTRNTKSLLDSKKNDTLAKGKNVLIIGSGDTSVDCVAVALRQGAKSIVRFERSPKRAEQRGESNPWPLKKQVFYTDYGLKEAIAVYGKDVREYQKLTKEFCEKNGKVTGVIAVDLEWKVENGKRVNREIQGSKKEYKADLILLAMGFAGGESIITESFGVEFDKRQNLKNMDYQTQRENLYVCGDARSGQSLVVWAIKDGIECAKRVEKALA